MLSALGCVRGGETRWKKASKCKKLIVQFQAQLINQKNRRRNIIEQSRADIAKLLQIGKFNDALANVEKLYKDTSFLTAYDLIGNFCECIITNMSHIEECSSVHNLPRNVAVAVASLIFAASRCGELSYLNLIKILFRDRYGREFETTNVELFVGNIVCSQLSKNLNIYDIPECEKHMLLNEIAQESKD